MKELLINQKKYAVTAPTDRLPWKIAALGGNRFEFTDGRGARLSGAAVKTREGLWAFIDGQSYFIQVPKERANDRAGGESGGTADSAAVISPMPAKVFRLHVKVGDTVKKGQELVVLEAMKMEHALIAGQDGKVAKCTIQEGQMVDLGQELILISNK
jgi:biotin carboxyl carrier protein